MPFATQHFLSYCPMMFVLGMAVSPVEQKAKRRRSVALDAITLVALTTCQSYFFQLRYLTPERICFVPFLLMNPSCLMTSWHSNSNVGGSFDHSFACFVVRLFFGSPNALDVVDGTSPDQTISWCRSPFFRHQCCWCCLRRCRHRGWAYYFQVQGATFRANTLSVYSYLAYWRDCVAFTLFHRMIRRLRRIAITIANGHHQPTVTIQFEPTKTKKSEPIPLGKIYLNGSAKDRS